MFYLIGIGLGDPTDISSDTLAIIQRCARVYLEAYTSVLLSEDKGSYISLVSNFTDRKVICNHLTMINLYNKVSSK